jgi:hypothetical protein
MPHIDADSTQERDPIQTLAINVLYPRSDRWTWVAAPFCGILRECSFSSRRPIPLSSSFHPISA